MSQAQQLSVSVYPFTQLPKEAKKIVTDRHIELGWYDYSDSESADYNQSLAVFNSAFNNTFNYLLVGDAAKEFLVHSINRAVQIQAKANHFFEESLKKEYGGEITNLEDALIVAKSCSLTGVCTDFYLMDTIIKFLDGTAYQDLTIKELLSKAKANGRNELNKICRFFSTRKHVEECLTEMCEDLFFKDGTTVPKALLDQAA